MNKKPIYNNFKKAVSKKTQHVINPQLERQLCLCGRLLGSQGLINIVLNSFEHFVLKTA